MRLTVSKWGNSLAVRIPAEMARELALEEGALVDCAATAKGSLELMPASRKTREAWLRRHFSEVQQRLAKQPITTPATQLLREEAKY